ncbi:MAG TPA: LacI family DNA-binding transcriptional regulator [Anaerolineaceae bacterium]|nr:LacI family DNA-binding transcriptional regulator [Anaerolineaceae bacterium]
MPLTLEKIAKLSGVSRSTVSRVINNDPNVKTETRYRVEEIIRQYNFQPNLAARGLAAGRTKVLGIVIPMGVQAIFTDPYFPLLIQGVSAACNARDHSVMLWLAEPEYERRTVGQIMHSGLIDGVIVASSMTDDPIIDALSASEFPFILVGRHPTKPDLPYVDVDNFNSAREVMAFLFQSGYQQIATITGPKNMIAGSDRLEGFLQAYRERGMAINQNLIAEGSFTEASGYACMRHILESGEKIDAVFAASDMMAMGALRALRERGLCVPDDVGLVGFDDIQFAATSDPPLTTMRQPIPRQGAVAAETLIDMIEQKDLQPGHILLATELVIRSSTRKI